MPSEQSLNELASAFESYQKGLAQRIASTSADNPLVEHLSKIHSVLTESMSQFLSSAKEHNQRMATTVTESQEAINKTRKAIEEKKKNLPSPKLKVVSPKVFLDPHLEEKLQLALKTPFGNRGNHS